MHKTVKVKSFCRTEGRFTHIIRGMLHHKTEVESQLMNLLTEIMRSPGLNLDGRMIFRRAVRGVVRQDGKILMVYSPVNGDYKFPGGGVEPEEDPVDALAREMREECGVVVISTPRYLGSVAEYDHPVETDYELFKMISDYYACEVDARAGFPAAGAG